MLYASDQVNSEPMTLIAADLAKLHIQVMRLKKILFAVAGHSTKMQDFFCDLIIPLNAQVELPSSSTGQMPGVHRLLKLFNTRQCTNSTKIELTVAD